MSQNPLQNYFRQPKIYLKLPSLGKYTRPDIISGDVENLPIYGMNGMDQILVKTPDALLNGESTVKIICSCCPSITNAWEITSTDIDGLLVAIRIATYGNLMKVSSTCGTCATENLYELDISNFLSHYQRYTFDSTVVVDDLVIKLKPLTYRNVTDYGIENFSLQKQLSQIYNIEDEKVQQSALLKIYEDFGILRNKLLVSSIDHVETPDGVVSEYGHIKEWIDNCDSSIHTAIREKIDKNSAAWKIPNNEVLCDTCGSTHKIAVDLDQSSFFDPA